MQSKNNSIFAPKTRFFIYFTAIFCYFITEISSDSCCNTFQNGTCVQCPSGMHLYMNNCIFDLPNCLRYAGGFYCIQCSGSFNLTNDNACIPSVEINYSTFPTTNYSELSKNYILNNGNAQQVISYLTNTINIGYMNIEDYIIDAFYQRVQTPKELELFRFIFQTKTGFLDVFLYYIQTNQLINIVNQTEFLINNQSNSYVYLYYDIQNDPMYGLIQMQLQFSQQFKGLPVNNFTLIDSYKANNPEINMYKLFYINNNVGLVYIKFELSVDGNQTTNNSNTNNGANNNQNNTNGSQNNANTTHANNNNSTNTANNSKPITNTSSIVIPKFIDKQFPLQNLTSIQQFGIGQMIASDSYGSDLIPIRLFIRSFLNYTYMQMLNISLDVNETIYGIDFQQSVSSNLTMDKQDNNESQSTTSITNQTDNDDKVVSVDDITYYQFLYTIKSDSGDFIILSWKQIYLNTSKNNNDSTPTPNNQTTSNNNPNISINGPFTLLTVNYTTISMGQYQNSNFYNALQSFVQTQRPIVNSVNVSMIGVDTADVWVNGSETNLNNTSFYLSPNNNNTSIKIPIKALIFTIFRLTYSLNQLLPYQIILSVNHNSSQILILSQIGQFNTTNSTNQQNNSNSNPNNDSTISHNNSTKVDSKKFTQDQLITQIASLLMTIYPELLSPTVLSNVSYVQYPNDYTPPIIKDPTISAIQAKNTYPSTYRVYTLIFIPTSNKNNVSYTFTIQYKNNQIDFLSTPPQANTKIDTSSSSNTNNQTSSNNLPTKNNTTNNDPTKNSTKDPTVTPSTNQNISTKANSTSNNNNLINTTANVSQVAIPQDHYITNKTIIQLNKLMKSLYTDIKNLQLQYVTIQSSVVSQIYELWYQDNLNVYGYRVGVNVQGVVSLYKIYKQQNIGQINVKIAAISVQAAININSSSTALNSTQINSSTVNKSNNIHPDINNLNKNTDTINAIDNSTNNANANKSSLFSMLAYKVTLLTPQQFNNQVYHDEIIMFLSVIDDSVTNKIVQKVYKNQTLTDPTDPNDKNITYLIYFAANSSKPSKKDNGNNIYELMVEVATKQMLILSINQDNEKLYQAHMKLQNITQPTSTSQVLQSTQSTKSTTVQPKNTTNENNLTRNISNRNQTSSVINSNKDNSNGGAIIITDNNQNQGSQRKKQQNQNSNPQPQQKNQPQAQPQTQTQPQAQPQTQTQVQRNKSEQQIQSQSQIMIQVQKIMIQNKADIQKEKSIISNYLNYNNKSQYLNTTNLTNSSSLKNKSVKYSQINLITWEDLEHRQQYKKLSVFMHKLKSMVMCTFLYLYQAKQNMQINSNLLTSQNYQLTYFGICSSSSEITHLKAIYEISYKDQSKLYILSNITNFDILASQTQINNQADQFINSSDSNNNVQVQNNATFIQNNSTGFVNNRQTQAFCQQFQTIYFFNTQKTNKNISIIPTTNQESLNVSNFYWILNKLQNSSKVQTSTSLMTAPSSNNSKGAFASFFPSLRTQTDSRPKGISLNQQGQNQSMFILMIKSKNIGQQNIYLTYNLNKTDEENQTLSMVQIHQIRNGQFIIQSKQILGQIQVYNSILENKNHSTMAYNYFITNNKTYNQSQSTKGKIFVPIDTAVKDMYYLASQQYAMYYYSDLLKDAELFEAYIDPVSPLDNFSNNLTNLQAYLNINALKLVFNSIYLVVNQSSQRSNNNINANLNMNLNPNSNSNSSNNNSNISIIVDAFMITTAYNQSTRRFDIKAIRKLETIQIKYDQQSSDQYCLKYEQSSNSSICAKCKDGYSVDNLNQIQQSQADPNLIQFMSGKCYKTVLFCDYQVWQVCLICKSGYVLAQDFKTCFKKL